MLIIIDFFCTFAETKICKSNSNRDMASQQILQILFSFLPFFVCLFWLICFVVQYRTSDIPKRYFTVYIATCVVLYLCHAIYFSHGATFGTECLWTLCSLSVYPLFYGYLCRLTSAGFRATKLVPWLVPGALIALARYAFPDAGVDKLRLLLFAIQVVCVCYLGIRKMKSFDKRLQSVYADTEERATTAVHHLLVAIIIASILSGVANSIGKQFFGESLWLLIPISLAFSVMLFALSYICFNRSFTVDQFLLDEMSEEAPKDVENKEDMEYIGKMIEQLMVEQHYFLKKDLKIGDVVKAVGSNRTYVSNYINRTYNCSFSDYTNALRVEFAKKILMSSDRNIKFSLVAEESGFSNEQSFYRNFRKFVGKTPAEWLESQSKAIEK